jgi:L-asparaginase
MTMTIAAMSLISTTSSVHADKPKVTILATGGTIAGKQGDPNAPGYKAGSFSVEDLVEAVPQLKDVATIDGQQVANIGSQNMHDAVWLKLLKATTEALAKPDVAGAVITHGTDTIEETSFFLNLTLKGDKPVVLVGSMRPATSLSADGPMNIYNAVIVAGSPEAKGRGVLVLMNDEIHYAAEVTKTDTTNPDSMKSPNRGLAGLCDTGKCAFYSPTKRRHTTESEFSIGDGVTELPDVAIVYAHANMGGTLIEAAIKAGAKGIVVAGVGDGNMTDPALDTLTRAAKDGVVVVRSARVGRGVVRRNIEVDDDELGFVAAQELNPQKARILLQLALMKTSDPGEIQKMFLEY